MSVFSFLRSAAAAVLLCAAMNAAASVGLIQFSAGDVKIRNAAGQLRDAVKGGTVDEGDTILTAAGASAQLKMMDGGILAVRPETELKVDTYRYAGKEDGNERAVMSLVKGGFRTITGIIGRTNKQNYTINTPTAVIGIRGTDHEPIVIPAIVGPGKPPAPAGTYDKVNVGQAFIRTPLGEVNIRQNQVGYAAPNQAPTLLPKVPEIFKATPPVRQAQATQKEEQQKQQSGGSQTSQASSSEKSSDTQSTQTAGSSSSSSDSGSSSSSTTSSTSSEMRSNATVDATPSTASTGSSSTTTAVVPTTTAVATVVTSTTTSTAPATVVQPVTGTSSDSSALTLNLTTQTTTSTTGTTTTLTENTQVPTTPSVASTNYGNVLMSQAPVDATTQTLEGVSSQLQSNTAYVIDQKKAVLEIQHTGHVRSNNQGVVQTIADANLKFSGGKTADIYVDAASTLYIGRQEGGNIRVADNSGVIPSFTQSLNSSSAHWLLALQPAHISPSGLTSAISNVQTVVGTSHYLLAAATHPTDLQGNVGTLKSASFSADFSSQTVSGLLGLSFSTSDTANRSRRDFELAAIASNVPIRRGGFDAIAGTSAAPFVLCTSGECAGQAYRGTIRGMFAAASSSPGGVGTGLGIGYSFAPQAGSGTSFEDLIQGTAVLSAIGGPAAAGTQHTFANNANVRHELFYDTFQTRSTTNVNFAVARDTITLVNPTTKTLTGARTNANYLFDDGGDLVRVYDTPYVIFDHGANVTATTTGFSAATPIANAQVSMGGIASTAADTYSDSTLGLRMGRWKGGVVNVTDLATGTAYVEDLGERSVHWLVRTATTSLPVSGVYHYSKVAATQPTDAYGNVGTLDRARLEVDFTRSTVSAGVAITMPTGSGGRSGSQSLTGYFTDAPLESSGFNVSSNSTDNAANTDRLHVNCRGSGCAANQTYGGRIRGGFSTGTAAANTAEGAYFRYSFVTNYANAGAAEAQGRVFDDYIDGFVAFKQGAEMTQPSLDTTGTFTSSATAKPAGDASIVYAYNYLANSVLQTRTNSWYTLGGGGYEVENPGKLANATGYFDDDSIKIVSSTGSFTTTAQMTSGTNSFQLAYGSYTSPAVSGKEGDTSFTSRAADMLHWIRGPAAYPFYVSMITDNPVTNAGNTIGYAKLGGHVTDQNGLAGTIDSAALAVNFGAQTVDAAVKATVGPTSSPTVFDAVANRIALEDMGSFWASKSGPVRHNFSSTGSTLTANGSTTSVNGSLEGALMGPGLEAAGFVFDFTSPTTRAIGSVVFGNPRYTNTSGTTTAFSASPLSDYHLGMVAFGMDKSGGLTKSTGGLVSEENNHRVNIGMTSPSRVQFVDSQTANAVNPAWALTKFDGMYPFGQNCSGTVCSGGVSEINARYAITDATGNGPLPINNTAIPAPTAKALEVHYDASTGMRWGRWGGGFVNVGDRADNNGTGSVPGSNGSGSINQIDLTANNWHYLLTGVQSGPVVLPVSGTFTYQLIGGTSPTSYTPGQTAAVVGTLTDATLRANFTAKTVDVGVNVRMSTTDAWAASATNVKILKDTAFTVDKALNGTGSLTVTRNGSTTNTAGQIVGGFTGQSGQGAGIAYSLNQGGSTGTTVSGVAAFKR